VRTDSLWSLSRKASSNSPTHFLPTNLFRVLVEDEFCAIFCSNLRRSFILVVIGQFPNCKGLADILLVCAHFLGLLLPHHPVPVSFVQPHLPTISGSYTPLLPPAVLSRLPILAGTIMASLSLDGSPTPRKKTPLNFFLHDEDQFEDENAHMSGGAVGSDTVTMFHSFDLTFASQQPKRDSNTAVSNAVPLTTSHFANQLPPPPPSTRNSSYKASLLKHTHHTLFMTVR
jgi:hypothetical protein